MGNSCLSATVNIRVMGGGISFLEGNADSAVYLMLMSVAILLIS